MAGESFVLNYHYDDHSDWSSAGGSDFEAETAFDLDGTPHIHGQPVLGRAGGSGVLPQPRLIDSASPYGTSAPSASRYAVSGTTLDRRKSHVPAANGQGFYLLGEEPGDDVLIEDEVQSLEPLRDMQQVSRVRQITEQLPSSLIHPISAREALGIVPVRIPHPHARPREDEGGEYGFDEFVNQKLAIGDGGQSYMELLLRYRPYCPDKPHLNALQEPCRQWPLEARLHTEDGEENPHFVPDDQFEDCARHKRVGTMYQLLKGKSRVAQSLRRRAKIRNRDLQKRRRIRRARQQRNTLEKNEMSDTRVSSLEYFWLTLKASVTKAVRGVSRRLVKAKPWDAQIRLVAGRFGTASAKFFLYTRWLIAINFWTALILLGFVLVPQALQDAVQGDQEGFQADNILNGDGFFNNTILFVGAYSNVKLDSGYDMPLAYVLAALAFFLVNAVIVAKSLASNYAEQIVTEHGRITKPFSECLFAGWDHAIYSPSSAARKKQELARVLSELLADAQRVHRRRTGCETAVVVAIRVVINILVLAILGGTLFAVNLVATRYLESDDFVEALFTPALIVFINAALPVAFVAFASIENYEDPKLNLRLLKVRSYLLRMVSVFVTVASVARRANDADVPCWETLLGQSLWNLMLVNMVLSNLLTFSGDLFRYAAEQWFAPNNIVTRLLPREFQKAKSTLEAIFLQTLVWTGTFYCPLLPVLGAIAGTVMFFSKYWSMRLFLLPPSALYRTDNNKDNFDLVLTLLSLLFSFFAVGYAAFNVTPSAGCGPFLGLNTQFDVVDARVEDQGARLEETIRYFGTAGFAVPALIVLMLVSYYYYTLGRLADRAVKDLQVSLIKQQEDKKYLIRSHDIQ